MSKNIFSYIQMGLRSKKTIEHQRVENQEKRKAEEQAFNKAFTDKTYTVAKKVIENVEKVADYDYESFFSRVNKVFDDKVTQANKTGKTKSSVNRAERSKEFEEKIKTYKAQFNIDDYKTGQKNYKDSIIEKTKRNIQTKLMEAEARQKAEQAVNKNDESSNKKMDHDDHFVSDSLDLQFDNEITMEIKANRWDRSKDQLDHHIQPQEEANKLKNLDSNKREDYSSDYDTETPVSSVQEITLEPLDLEIPMNKLDVIELPLETSISDEKTLESNTFEAAVELPYLNDETTSESITDRVFDFDVLQNEDDLAAKTTIQKNNEEDHLMVETPYEDKPEILMTRGTENRSSVSLEESEISHDLLNSEVHHVDMTDVSEEGLKKKRKTKKNRSVYNKENVSKNSKYHKSKRKEKFAKRMKVELEDNLIVKKRRSFSRLFKFSLAFKLSFVFVFLLIITIVALSISFYLGIDYVVSLKDAGKLDDIQTFKDVLLVLLVIFDLVAILLCISIGTKASRELVRPIDEMTMIVKQINAKEMDRRLNVKGMHDELKELAMTFNEMLDRIENSYETQNRFTSDASHELRTPIAVIQGYINMLDRWGKADGAILDESIEAIKSESSNMKRLTEKLLLLAKADKGILELEFKPFSLEELIDEITKETAMIDHNHKIYNKINSVKEIVADRESLKQAIRIFVDNSVKYTPDNGEISINSYFNKKNIFIEISDNGIGIGKEDMNNVFNRFYRVDKSRTKESGGHGLGLSIAKWIISQHKGEIEVKSELNKGTVVTIILQPPA